MKCIKTCVLNGRMFQPGELVADDTDVGGLEHCFERPPAPASVKAAEPEESAPGGNEAPEPEPVEIPLPGKKKKEK